MKGARSSILMAVALLLTSCGGKKGAEDPSPAPAWLESVAVRRESGMAHLSLSLKFTNDSAAEVDFSSPSVKLLAGESEVPRLIFPFSPRSVVPAGATQFVPLDYWMEIARLSGPLVLEINDQRTTIKQPGEIAPDIPDGNKIPLSTATWSPLTN